MSATSKSLLNAAALRLQGHDLKSSKQINSQRLSLFCQETTTFTPQVLLVCRFAAKNDSLLVVVMCFVNGRSVMFVCWTNVLTVYISLSVGLCLSLSVHACLSQPTRCIFTCLSVRVSWCICLCLSQCICP